MKKSSIWHLAASGLFIALGLLLPFFTGQIPYIGARLLPMHIPILLCGFVCGWPYGLAVGFITPLFRSVLFGSPPMYPIAIAMAFELAVYGFLTGLLSKLLPKKPVYVYVALLSAMVAGRLAWGAASLFLYGLKGNAFTFSMFISDAFLNAIPGIIIQIVLIPVVVIALKQANLIKHY